MNVSRFLVVLAAAFLSDVAFGSGGLPHFINYYQLIGEQFGIETRFLPVLSSILVLCLLYFGGVIFSRTVERMTVGGAEPTGKFGLALAIEIVMDVVCGLAKDQCGERYRNFMTLLSTIFLFVLVCNLSGLVPGFPPATESMSTNVAIGLVVFFVYNWAGVKEHGVSYIKQFLGPVAFIAPLFFCIELFSHFSRPISLGLRLTGNIFGDHLLLGVFTGLVPFVVPAVLMFFGLLVACIQSFVFTLLTGIYISMAISHDH